MGDKQNAQVNEQEQAIFELRQACNCLYLEVGESVAADVRKKAEAVISMLATARAEQRERDAQIADAEKRKGLVNAKDKQDSDYDEGYSEAAQFIAAAIREDKQ